MKVVEIEAPNDYKGLVKSLSGMYDKVVSVFLAGTIDMNSKETVDWQKNLVNHFKNMDETKENERIALVLLNPRRDEWDSSWKQEKGDNQFTEQVTWELESQEECDIIFMNFEPNSKSPITLLELGLFKDSNIMVVCSEDFYRLGNVDITCERYGVEMVTDYGEGIEKLYQKIIE